MRCLLLILLLLPGLAFGAVSNVAVTPRDAVSLISEANQPVNGTVTLGLKFQLAPGWHIYWSNPGDAGLSPQILLDAPARAGPLAFPPPALLQQGPVTAYVLSGDVVLPFTATGLHKNVSATAQWLVCRDVCVPEHARFLLTLQGGASAEAGLFAGPQIIPSPFIAQIAPDGTLAVHGISAAQLRAARFFPAANGAIINSAAQPLGFTADGMMLHLSPAPGFSNRLGLDGVLELTDPSGATQALRLHATPGAAAATTPLLAWLGLAFLGGLILNLMPCVFPILAMKALSLMRLSGQARAHVRREAIVYTLGVLTAMLLLAGVLLVLRLSGNAAGWGFQFQSPVFVALIAWLILAAGLNLAGLFEVFGPGISARLTHNSFLTGLLAVAVATPCTAPFMGAAIAAALLAPWPVTLGIFLALGLGLAAPFLLLALVPHLAALLPRPGRWMILLQRLLSLPMLATFVWLAWVMFREAGSNGFLLLLLGAAVLALTLTWPRRRLAGFAALLVLPFLHTHQAGAALSLPGAQPFSAKNLATARAQGPVFVDMTAAWCVTCLVNEKAVLATPAMGQIFAAHGVRLLVGDWTSRDPAITAFLQENHRDGVPLYVYYAAPGAAPVVLPQILDVKIVKAALR